MNWKEYREGVRDSVPVGLGYFSVSFGFGTIAVSQGLLPLVATLISLTNLTSAGQFAGLTVIASAGSIIVMILTQLIINSRYALMSLALSQKMGKEFGIIQRMIMAFYNTDEIFALAIQRSRPLTTSYMYGLGVLPMLGWSAGTLIGGYAGTIFPMSVRTALGVALYGMFVAIVVPQAKRDTHKLAAAIMAAAISAMFTWIYPLNEVSSGLSVVICTVISAAVCALLFPIEEREETK